MSEPLAPGAGADGVRLTSAACLALCDALPRAPDFDAAMHVVEGVRHSLLGAGLLTVNLLTTPIGLPADDSHVLVRAWSSDPAAYPPGGRKHKMMTDWSRHLLRDGQVFIGEGDADLAQAFDDHALITWLGWHSIVNVPLLDAGGDCFATFNALGPRSHWRGDEVLLLRLLATLATPAVARRAQQQQP